MFQRLGSTESRSQVSSGQRTSHLDRLLSCRSQLLLLQPLPRPVLRRAGLQAVRAVLHR